jgi:large subunit ribosomal protein L5e
VFIKNSKEIMAFLKSIKSRNYFMRYQVKFRRRRECKTDYYARQRLIIQDKNKYASPKYRLVVRVTCSDIVAQIVHSKIIGDVVMCAAYAHELPRYGVQFGLTNYAAAYCTGLLCARRLLTKLNLAETFKGQDEVKGEEFDFEAIEGARSFKAYLDVGLRRTTTGSRIFAVVKGACDGGVNVPHSQARFVGFDKEKGELNMEVFKNHLLGKHVADYMKAMSAENEDKYKTHFSRAIKAGVKPEDVEKMYKKAHAAIRKDPSAQKKEHKKVEAKKPKKLRVSRAQRRARGAQILAHAAKAE